MDTQMKINGKMIRALREEKSWSQDHLADASGLSVRTIQRVESDSIGSAETRLALAAALGVAASVLKPASLLTDAIFEKLSMPAGAWLGWGGGAVCSSGAVAYTFYAGDIDAEQLWRSLGVINGLLGATLGLMFALNSWIKGRRSAA